MSLSQSLLTPDIIFNDFQTLSALAQQTSSNNHESSACDIGPSRHASLPNLDRPPLPLPLLHSQGLRFQVVTLNLGTASSQHQSTIYQDTRSTSCRLSLVSRLVFTSHPGIFLAFDFLFALIIINPCLVHGFRSGTKD